MNVYHLENWELLIFVGNFREVNIDKSHVTGFMCYSLIVGVVNSVVLSIKP